MVERKGRAESDVLPRLLVLTSTYPRWAGDPEPAFVHELAKRLTRDFRVIVLSPHAPGAKVREILDGVEVVRYCYAPEHMETLVNNGGIVTNLRRSRWKFLLLPTFLLAQAWQAWRLVRIEGIDVIHAHWLLPQGLVAAMLQMLVARHVPFIATAHGSDVQALRGWVMDALRRLVCRSAMAITFASRSLQAKLMVDDISRSNMTVLSMGVDLFEKFTPDTHVPRSDNEILFVGRLVENKGVGYLLNAMRGILCSRPDARLTIAGFGPMRSELEHLVVQLGLSGVVNFVGAVSQSRLPDLYRRAALLVAPFSKGEGLGLVLVEAIGCGCPVLAGDAPAVADVLGDGFSKMTVDPRDVPALTQRIIAMLDDPAVTRAHALALRPRLVERFDWSRVADGYRQLLTKTS